MGRKNAPALILALLLMMTPAPGILSMKDTVVDHASDMGEGGTPELTGKAPSEDISPTPVKLSPLGFKRPAPSSASLSSGAPSPLMVNERTYSQGPPASLAGLEPISGLTRASDLEKEKSYNDYANGSLVDTPLEVLTGSLSYDPEGTSDLRDWYKLRIPDVDVAPMSPNGLHWTKLHLLSYSNATGGTDGLYEYNVIGGSPPTLEHDYADMLGITVLYYDPWLGPTYLGGTRFLYDDMDDTDGASPRSGWYYNCTTPVPSTGQEDPDGFANGLGEVGWYYFGINLDFYMRTGAPERGAFGVRYELLVDTSGRVDSDDGANVRETALENAPQGESTITSHTDHVDWYKFKGTDTSKIWNQTFVINRTMGLGGREGNMLYDTWVYVFVVWWGSGSDGIYGSSDDELVGIYVIFSFFLSGGPFLSNAAQSLGIRVNNTWTKAADRSIYVGLYVEPATILVSGSTIIAFLAPSWTTVSNMTVEHKLREESFNRRPVISSLSVSSSNPNYPTQGDLRDMFTFEVTYQDADDDPPGRLDLFVGPKENVWTVFSLLGKEKDPKDTLYQDGKTYVLRLTGEQLGSYPVFHSVKVNATDRMQVWSLRSALTSHDRWLNNTLFVFDDRPVLHNGDFQGIDPLTEDGGRYSVHLEKRTGNGPFDDPENDFRGFYVYDGGKGRWVTATSVGPVSVNISKDPLEGWLLNLEPLPDAHGSAELRLKAYDDHSSIERSVDVTVESVNDPPVFLSVVVNGRTFQVTEVVPSRFRLDLRGGYDLEEDRTYNFKLAAVDTDPEADRGTLVFSTVPSRTDNWEVEPTIMPSTGEVTVGPTNGDVVRKSSRMTFSVTDGSDVAELELLVNVKNVNDPPELSVRDTALEVDQFDRLRVQPTARDIDPDDVLVFHVNFEEDLGTEFGTVLDQLPFFDPVKGVDWDMDPNTGELWFEPSSDEIWRDPEALLMERTVHIVVEVKDRAGAADSVVLTVRLLKMDIWVPKTPAFTYSIEDEDPLTPGVQGLTVQLIAEGFDEALYPGWVHTWDFGDGSRGTGRTVSHTYVQEGYKVITLRLTKDASASQVRFLNITLEAVKEGPEQPRPEEKGSAMLIIATAVVVVLAILALAAVVLVLRGRKGGGMGGPGQEGTVKGQTDLRAPPKAMERKDAPRTGPSDAGVCPKCGAPVRSGWFLCPSCKSNLN